MTSLETETILRKCFEDVVWMAIRYAHGRNTYAPDMVRDAVMNFKKVYPTFKLRPDRTIQAPEESELKGFNFKDDYLNDLFED